MKLKTMGLEYVIDPRLANNYPKKIYDDIIKLAMDCASFDSEDRPSMKVKYCKYVFCQVHPETNSHHNEFTRCFNVLKVGITLLYNLNWAVYNNFG